MKIKYEKSFSKGKQIIFVTSYGEMRIPLIDNNESNINLQQLVDFINYPKKVNHDSPHYGFCKWLEGFLAGNEQNTDMTEAEKDLKIETMLKETLYGEVK